MRSVLARLLTFLNERESLLDMRHRRYSLGPSSFDGIQKSFHLFGICRQSRRDNFVVVDKLDIKIEAVTGRNWKAQRNSQMTLSTTAFFDSINMRATIVKRPRISQVFWMRNTDVFVSRCQSFSIIKRHFSFTRVKCEWCESFGVNLTLPVRLQISVTDRFKFRCDCWNS